MDMRNNKRRNVLTHAQVNFSQSETSSLLRGGGLNFELLLWGGGGGGGELTEKIRNKIMFLNQLLVLRTVNFSSTILI